MGADDDADDDEEQHAFKVTDVLEYNRTVSLQTYENMTVLHQFVFL